MNLVCVNNAAVSITPTPPLVLILNTTNIPGGAQSKLMIANQPALIELDITNWVSTYTSPYTSGSFSTPGTVMGSSATLTGLSTKTAHAGSDFVVVQTTSIMLQLQVVAPAIMPSVPPVTDPVPMYQATVTFTTPGQTKFLTA